MPYNNRFIVFDLETGGLIKKGVTPPVTEIAIVVMDNELNIIKEYSSLIKPFYDKERAFYDPKALEVSHITLDMCEKEGEESSVVAKEIQKILSDIEKGEKKSILCGHNIDDFDIPILDDFLSFHKIDLSKLVETKFTIDTKWWSRMKYPEFAKYDLGFVLENTGVDLTNAHRALTDTKGNAELVKDYIKCLRGSNSPKLIKREKTARSEFKFQFKEY